VDDRRAVVQEYALRLDGITDENYAALTRFMTDGRICLTNNAAERALRGLALGRRAWLFAGSNRGAERAAVMITLIQTARLNDVDPQVWLADVFARIPAHPHNRLHELLPWNWKRQTEEPAAAEAACRGVHDRLCGAQPRPATVGDLATVDGHVYGAGDFLYSQIYSIDPDSGWSLWRESDYLDGIGTTVLPFSDNGCGDYLLFKLVDGACLDRIYCADHESEYELSESDYEDFNTFVARVALTA
jgi:hypothetical protein